MNIIQKPYRKNLSWKKNDSDKVKGVCIHIAEGNNLDEWANSPQNNGSSWHFAVFKNGEIHSYVPEDHFAWSNGMNWKGSTPINARGLAMDANKLAPIIRDNKPHNPNDYLLSIEHQGFTGQSWTDAMYNSDARLIIHLSEKYGFPIDRYHIVGHCEIDHIDRTRCPGTGFNFEQLFAEIEKVNKPQDDLYRVFKKGKQIGAYSNEDNAFESFCSNIGDKIIYKEQDLTLNFQNEMKKVNELTAKCDSLSNKVQEYEIEIEKLKNGNTGDSNEVERLKKIIEEKDKRISDLEKSKYNTRSIFYQFLKLVGAVK